jgi:hypothetical protein
MGERGRGEELLDRVHLFLHRTGVAWLTPFIGRNDGSDLESLRSSILRDLEWADVLWMEAPSQEQEKLQSLNQVRADLAALLGRTADVGTTKANKSILPVLYPWHLARGWSDYGAIRLALLASLPPRARRAALAELRNMKSVVLSGSQLAWEQLAQNVEELLKDAKRRGDESIPHKLQALWREVDFGRNARWVRTAKQSTISGLTWFLVLAATLAVASALSRREPADPNPWLIVLLGLLGGSVSALRSVKDLARLPERSPVENEAVKLRLRPVVGAMAALMLYVIGRSGLVFQLVTVVSPDIPARIQIRVENVAWAYYALAFVAGFSERLFLGMLSAVENSVSRSAPSGDGSGGSASDGKRHEVTHVVDETRGVETKTEQDTSKASEAPKAQESPPAPAK